MRRNISVRGDEECWPWTGPTLQMPRSPNIRHSYGKIRAFDPLDSRVGRTTYAHRVTYMMSKGPIPKGMTVDHICFNPNCCNPAHLQLLTLSENAARKNPNSASPG